MEEARDQVDELMSGQPQMWRLFQACAPSMALRCAVELRIPDIMHSHGGPITISQVAASIGSPSLDASYLTRVMRVLVRKGIFSVEHPSDGGEPVYGLTSVSRWLVRDSDLTMAPLLLFLTHPSAVATWHSLSRCVSEGGSTFEKAHGCEIWELAAQNPEFNRIVNDAMACTNAMVARGIAAGYKDGFSCIGSLVDVGGGTGSFLAEIVKMHPHIKGVNYDLPHVIGTAPVHEGITHVGGSMFEAIPSADAALLKCVLHNWGDEDCVKILRNCRRAINGKTGKVIIVEIVLEPEGEHPLDEERLTADLMMMAYSPGGKERTELQWRKLLQEGGFSRLNFFSIPALPAVIEAYPD